MTAQRIGLFLLTALFCSFLATRAFAQAKPQLTVKASAQRVEVGELFTVEMHALVDRGSPLPTDPSLSLPAGITLAASNVMQQQVRHTGPTGTVIRVGILSTWHLVASKPGRYIIRAPTVLWKGKRFAAESFTIEVTPPTGLPKRSRSPFLSPGSSPFGFPWPFGFDDRDDEDDETSDPQLQEVDSLFLRTAPDPNIFLYAFVDKKTAVIGEQVTISFYIYHRIDAEMNERREAPLSDFLRVPLLKNPGTDPAVIAVAGDQRYQVRLLDKIAIFPLRAGDLHTGSMSLRFSARRIGSRVLRQSNDIVVRVAEPPRQNRPPGYVLGDVGRFTLAAEVQPRKIKQGEAIGVTLRVEGNGNFPQSLKVPERTGVEWLDPDKREAIEPVNGLVSGSRTFQYLVRLKESGPIQLGTVDLPFWDPAEKRYRIASAALGIVDVVANPSSTTLDPASSPDAGAETKPETDVFAALPAPRMTLGTYSPAASPRLSADTRFLFILAAPPFLFALVVAAERTRSRLRALRSQKASSPERLATHALEEAEQALYRADAKEAATALERSLHYAIQAATGLKSRGVLASALPAELERLGIPADLALRVGGALSACDEIRFDPMASATTAPLADSVRAVVRELLAGSGGRIS